MERIRRLERSKWREREKRKRNIIKRLKKRRRGNRRED